MTKKHVTLLLLSLVVVFVLYAITSGEIGFYTSANPTEEDVLFESLKESDNPFLNMEIDQLLDKALVTLDPSLMEMIMALLERKNETLPLVQNRLQNIDPKDDGEGYALIMLVHGWLFWEELCPEIQQLVANHDLPERVRGRAATALALFRGSDFVQENISKIVNDIQYLLETGEDSLAKEFAAIALGNLATVTGKEQNKTSKSIIEGHIENILNNSQPMSLTTHEIEEVFSLATYTAMITYFEPIDEKYILNIVNKRLINSDNFGLRIAAADVLFYLRTPEALLLLENMQEDESPNVRIMVNEFLNVIELENMERKDAINELKKQLEDFDDYYLTEDPDYYPPLWAFEYLTYYFLYDAEDFFEIYANPSVERLEKQGPGPLMMPSIQAIKQLEAGICTIPYEQRKIGD